VILCVVATERRTKSVYADMYAEAVGLVCARHGKECVGAGPEAMRAWLEGTDEEDEGEED